MKPRADQPSGGSSAATSVNAVSIPVALIARLLAWTPPPASPLA